MHQARPVRPVRPGPLVRLVRPGPLVRPVRPVRRDHPWAPDIQQQESGPGWRSSKRELARYVAWILPERRSAPLGKPERMSRRGAPRSGLRLPNIAFDFRPTHRTPAPPGAPRRVPNAYSQRLRRFEAASSRPIAGPLSGFPASLRRLAVATPPPPRSRSPRYRGSAALGQHLSPTFPAVRPPVPATASSSRMPRNRPRPRNSAGPVSMISRGQPHPTPPLQDRRAHP
jgi:hypothetical protein